MLVVARREPHSPWPMFSLIAVANTKNHPGQAIHETVLKGLMEAAVRAYTKKSDATIEPEPKQSRKAEHIHTFTKGEWPTVAKTFEPPMETRKPVMDDIPQHLGEDASGKSVWEELLPEWRETPPLVEETKRPLDLPMHATDKRPRVLSPPKHYNHIPYQRRKKAVKPSLCPRVKQMSMVITQYTSQRKESNCIQEKQEVERFLSEQQND